MLYFYLWGHEIFLVNGSLCQMLADLNQVLLQYKNTPTVLIFQLKHVGICDLFYDTVSSSDYIASECWWYIVSF
jgi:hypothetical protein